MTHVATVLTEPAIGRTRLRLLPVIELFGPTLQGEGPQQGRPAHFVRFGGCDFRCSWCDSLHAVDPATVRASARHLSTTEIMRELEALDTGPDLVVLSGGNPALLELGELTDALHASGYSVAVETQGSRWKQWLAAVDCLVVSPKGPSSGMDSDLARDALDAFLARATDASAPAVLKVVIFDEADLDFARWLAATYDGFELFLSVGTDVGFDDDSTVAGMLGRLRWLSEAVAGDPVLRHARVGAQQHVLTWGTRKGV
jgi:7-carboxy-7-deazaguanine synthase